MMENLSLSPLVIHEQKESAEKERERDGEKRELRSARIKSLSLVPRSVSAAKEKKSLSRALKRVRESDFAAQRGVLVDSFSLCRFFFLISLNRERFETRLHHFLIF